MELSRERKDGEDGLMLMICMYRNCKGNGMKEVAESGDSD
jgi:hypothetical protein